MDDAGSDASARYPTDAPAGSNLSHARRVSTQSTRSVDEREKTAYTALPDSSRHIAPDAASRIPGAFWWLMAHLVGQSFLTTLIVVFVMFFVDQRSFNVTQRRPHYQLANGTIVQVSFTEWWPLQSDITTAISGAFNLLGKCYAAWIAAVTWNYAFLLLQRNGMRLKTLSAMISLPIIPELFPPPGTEVDPSQKPSNRAERQRLSIGIALVMLSVFPASFSPPLLTGSITWRASIRGIPNADVVQNIGLGVTGDDMHPWGSWTLDNNFRPRFINRATALATRAWNNVTDSSQDSPTFKRVVPSLQNIPVATSLRNISVPWFNIESFSWITNSSDISTDLLSLVMFNATPGVLSSADEYTIINPLQHSLRSVAILPDIPYASLNVSSDWTTLRPAKSEHQMAIVAVNINYAGECDSGAHTQFGDLPSGIYTHASKNIWGYENCFVFAHITYSAGMATCYECVVVFPILVESPPAAKVTLEADVMTPHALYVMADVIGQLVDANVTLPPTWNNMENYTKEMLLRGYSGAWTAMSELFAFYTPYLSTPATIPVTMSRAVVDHRRVWAWFAIQGLAFVGGVAFLIHIVGVPYYPISSPLLHGLMLDIGMSDRARQQAAEHVDSWAEDYRGTFIVWERGADKSAFAVKGSLEEGKRPFILTILNRVVSLWWTGDGSVALR